MKYLTAAFVLILTGCSSVPWERGSEVSEATCSATCDAHFSECPRIFAGFPARGAVECPAEHENCLRSCTSAHSAASTSAAPAGINAAVMPAPTSAPDPPPQPAALVCVPASNREARLRELKHLYEEGLIVEDVYKDRQRTLLGEP
jgi:hypothetical protein